jgi:chemotaxis protein CheX
MPIELPVAEDRLTEMVVESINKVFSTMSNVDATLKDSVRLDLNPADADERPLPTDAPQVVGSVGFIGGANGVLYLFFTEELALTLASRMLGFDPGELEASDHETINDALGELTNMTVGTFKNQLCDEGFNCRLTVPSILRGSSFCVETTSSVFQRIFRFNVEGQSFAAELFLKPGE